MLAARSKRNPSFFADYKKLMDSVIKVTSSNISSHHFVMEDPMKEVSLEDIFQTMYKNDFNEGSTIKLNNRVMKDAEEVSSEDR